MIRIVTSEKLRALKNEANDLSARCTRLDKNNEYLSKQIDELQAHLEDAQRDIQTIRDENERLLDTAFNSYANEVTIRIGDDLTSLTPVVRWKGDETSEKLIELGYLKDANNTKTSTQVALMLIALEGLEQIVEDFQPTVQEE